MQFSMNKVILVGNCTKDPELRYTPNGTAVMTFGIATSRSVKKGEGQYEDETTFHNIVVWSKMAEFYSERLKKGQFLTIEGRIQNRSYEAKDGSGKRYVSEIVAENMFFKSPKPASQIAKAKTEADQLAEEAKETLADPTTAPEGTEAVNPEDIPF